VYVSDNANYGAYVIRATPHPLPDGILSRPKHLGHSLADYGNQFRAGNVFFPNQPSPDQSNAHSLEESVVNKDRATAQPKSVGVVLSSALDLERT
jgi:hypothetical protein